jgi:hypothetical protein
MLLPPQFQTPAPDALGAKVVAMPAPPKPPHEHQWLAVPDSKIHSRCAECGTVTLTEIVAPKVSFASALQTMVMTSPKPTFAPDGWLPNPGHQPVADDVRVQVKTELCSFTVDVPARTVNWAFAPITHYRVVA